MISVHGSFVPYGTSGFFFLWGIDSQADSGPDNRRALSLHPQAVPVELLYPTLRGVPHANATACAVQIPGPKGPKPKKVPGIALSVASAAQWLLDLDTVIPGVQLKPGQSLKAWSAAAKLLLELLGRGRFLPLLRAEAGCLAAEWRLSSLEPIDAARFAQLEAALPDVCRAIVPPDRNHKTYRAPSAGALLGMFVRSATDSLAGLFLSGEDMPIPRTGRSAVPYWLLGLKGNGKRDLPPGLPDAGALYAAVDAWAAPASGARGHSALRTGIRLNLPGDTEHGGWEAELVLQTATDPPVTVSGRAAWDAIGQELEIGDQRYLNAEQRLLGDLPVMARLYPPLEPLRFAATPSRQPIDGDAVIALLQESASLLQEAGFPVMLPAELVRGTALRARMHLKPVGTRESVLGLSQLVDVDWDLALGGVPISYDELRRLARQKRPLVQFNGYWVQVDPKALAGALRNLEPYREQIALGTALRLAARVAPAAGADAANVQGAEGERAAGRLLIESTTGEGWVADLLGKLQEPARLEPVPVPLAFRGALRPYQQRGLDWLSFLRRYGMGACLADDMGLGKTVQVIALLVHERERGWTDRPILLVCPVSIVGNWRRELARFAPSLRVLVHHGAGRAADESFLAHALRHDVVITTYSLVARDEEELAAVPWAGLVADEAQNLKNPVTKQAQALRRIKAGYRIALTGTPVENHLGDLWSIFEFLNPGFLGGLEEFRRTLALPIERYRDADATARLRRLVQPLLLRRLKTDPSIIEDLPEKLEMTVVANLTVEQAALYEAVVQETLERATRAEGIQRHGAVLAGLTKLKQVCNHPASIVGDSGSLTGRSGKLERLTEMLQEVIAEGDRALIFTQFAQFGARLQQHLERQLGCTALFLHGGTPQEERDKLIARFQSGEAPLFVLSLKAGGVGVNLTAANHVFHFDRWWNPAVEDQATDRAYRIGQTRRVLVHKLVTAGTLEERIDKLLTDKRALSDRVIGAGEAWLGSLSTEELRELITLERE